MLTLPYEAKVYTMNEKAVLSQKNRAMRNGRLSLEAVLGR